VTRQKTSDPQTEYIELRLIQNYDWFGG